MKIPEIRVRSLWHRDCQQLALDFPYNETLIAVAKGLQCKWSRTQGCRYVRNTRENLKKVFAAFRDKAWVDARAVFAPKACRTLKARLMICSNLITQSQREVNNMCNFVTYISKLAAMKKIITLATKNSSNLWAH